MRGPVTPRTAWRFERGLAQTLCEVGRRLVELAFHRLEPEDVRMLPARVQVGGQWYRRNSRKPRGMFCWFGPLTLQRVLYQAVEAGLPGVCPLEQALGIVAHLATPALADQVGRLSAELTQQQTRDVLAERHHVSLSVGSLRKVVAALAESLAPLRQAHQVEQVLAWLKTAQKSRGKHRPSLVAGRDGVMLQTRPCWEEASTATLTVYDRRGQRLGSVYLGRMPELGQGTLTQQLRDLLVAVLEAWQGPLPRLHYVTDAGSHPLEFYRRLLRRMRHPRTGERLPWTWSVDYYHAAQRISKLAEVLLGVGREARAWATKMRKVLRDKPGGAGRLLHSAGALRKRLGLTGTKKEYDTAANYLRRFSKHMTYARYRGLGLPIGSGVTEAACKTIIGYRFKQSGMRWCPATGQHVLDLRVILKSGIWRSTLVDYLQTYQSPHTPTPAASVAATLQFPAVLALPA